MITGRRKINKKDSIIICFNIINLLFLCLKPGEVILGFTLVAL
jgi:hypothetical protein